MKPVIIIALIWWGIFIGIALVPTLRYLDDTFLTSRVGAEAAQAEAPAHLTFSPPSESGADIPQPPAHILSTIDLQRELNRRYPDLKLAEDGVYGPATEAAHVRAIGDQYAKEFMVKTRMESAK